MPRNIVIRCTTFKGYVTTYNSKYILLMNLNYNDRLFTLCNERKIS